MISLNTQNLKDALSKVSKCAKNDKTAPLTQLIYIKTVDSHTIQFTTTDEKNIFSYYIKDELQEFENLDLCIMVDQFIKLVSKFNSAKTDLWISESGNELIVRGDGKYSISIPMDPEGNVIKYPTIDVGDPITEVYSGNISPILDAVKYCEGSITKLTYELQAEDYPRTNYYVGNNIVALDGFLVTKVEGPYLPFSTLISPAVIKLLSNFSDENFKMYKTKLYNVFECDYCKLYAIEPEGLDIYPIEIAEQTIDAVDGNVVDISASVLSNALNRLSLFTEDRYENSIKLVFNSQGMFAYTIDDSCNEQISATPLNDNFTCYINIQSLISLLKAYNNEIIHVYYGDEQIIKFVCNNISQISVLSTLEE